MVSSFEGLSKHYPDLCGLDNHRHNFLDFRSGVLLKIAVTILCYRVRNVIVQLLQELRHFSHVVFNVKRKRP